MSFQRTSYACLDFGTVWIYTRLLVMGRRPSHHVVLVLCRHGSEQ